jgi:hypothetical protein
MKSSQLLLQVLSLLQQQQEPGLQLHVRVFPAENGKRRVPHVEKEDKDGLGTCDDGKTSSPLVRFPRKWIVAECQATWSQGVNSVGVGRTVAAWLETSVSPKKQLLVLVLDTEHHILTGESVAENVAFRRLGYYHPARWNAVYQSRVAFWSVNPGVHLDRSRDEC